MKAVLEVKFKSKKIAENAYFSLLHEIGYKRRSKGRLSIRDERLKIFIQADDISALRACVNSYLRLLNIIFSILKVNYLSTSR